MLLLGIKILFFFRNDVFFFLSIVLRVRNGVMIIVIFVRFRGVFLGLGNNVFVFWYIIVCFCMRFNIWELLFWEMLRVLSWDDRIVVSLVVMIVNKNIKEKIK